MGLLSTILNKLGLQKDEQPAAPVKKAPMGTPQPGMRRGMPVAGRPAEIPMVDVAKKLDALAKAYPVKVNWRVSIADMLALLGIEHGYQARKELAQELGCPEDMMSDSARMNVWLHKTVLKKIAENGGNVPRELLD